MMKTLLAILGLTAMLAAADGAALYKTNCASCHGATGEKKALNKSQVIKDFTQADFVAALKGYKDGTYGGAMKALMKGQVAKLSDADMEAIAKEIASK
ncbi:MAG: c-type cytochrome [Sulfurimonadaceae bacterium]|nr:c-type cytochrome [Sulfurimonadaceae bacterium]